MALIGISQPDRPYQQPHQNTMQQIAEGLNAAANILGIGINAYKTFGIDKPAQEAQSNYLRAEADSMPTRYGFMQANPMELAKGQGNVIAGGGQDESGSPILYVPKNEDSTGIRAMMQDKHENDQWAMKAIGQMDSLRGNKAINSASEVIRQAQNAKSVVSGFLASHPGSTLADVPTSLLPLFNAEIGKIGTGGVATEGIMKELDDPTMYRDFKGFVGKLTNTVQGAGQSEQIPIKMQYLDDLINNSKDFVKTSFDRKLNLYTPHLKKEDVEAIKSANASFLDQIGGISAAAQNLTPNTINGAMNPAMAGPHGQTVIQGGHTYQWNPQTKQYE